MKKIYKIQIIKLNNKYKYNKLKNNKMIYNNNQFNKIIQLKMKNQQIYYKINNKIKKILIQKNQNKIHNNKIFKTQKTIHHQNK